MDSIQIFSADLGTWHWLGAGVFLIICEVLTMSGFLLALGFAAFITGAIVWLNPYLSPTHQVLSFSVLAMVSCVIWWFVIRKVRKQPAPTTLNRRAEQYVGRTFTLEDDLKDGIGRIRVDDSMWRIEVASDLSAGTKVKIVATEGATLKAEAVASNNNE